MLIVLASQKSDQEERSRPANKYSQDILSKKKNTSSSQESRYILATSKAVSYIFASTEILVLKD